MVYESLWRSFVTLREVMQNTDTSDIIDAREALNKFCRNAFELRDWLGSDVGEAAKAAAWKLFGKPSNDPCKRISGTSVALAACADIANASKHGKLHRPSYSE